MIKRVVITILVILFGIYGSLHIINAKNAKKVVYSLEERDARLKNTIWALFPDQN